MGEPLCVPRLEESINMARLPRYGAEGSGEAFGVTPAEGSTEMPLLAALSRYVNYLLEEFSLRGTGERHVGGHGRRRDLREIARIEP